MNSSLAIVSDNRASDGTQSLHLLSDSSEWAYFAGVLSPEYINHNETYDVEFSFYPESNEDSDYLFQIFDVNATNALVSVVVL